MMYKKSDYAINKYSEGIVYRSVTGEKIIVTYEELQFEFPQMDHNEFLRFQNISLDDYRTSYNIDQKETRYLVDIEDIHDQSDPSIIPLEELIEYKCTMKKLSHAIKSLTDVQQRRVRLFYFEEKTAREIALLEGASHQSVLESLNAAKKKMKKFFEMK